MDSEKEAPASEGLAAPREGSHIHSPDNDMATPKGHPVSLRKLKESHIQQFHQQFMQEAAQMRQMTPGDLPLELRQALYGAAVKAATERVYHIRKGILAKTARSQSPTKKPPTPSAEQR